MKPTSTSASVSNEASEYRWLRTGAEGLEAMLEAIRGARERICFEMYIFAPGALSERFREALVAAQQRGVHVLVLLDAFGSMDLPSKFWEPLLQAGGEMHWFNPFRATERYGRRDHRKLLVVDGDVAVVGGFNVSNEYDGDGVQKGWRDLGLRIRGPLAEKLEKSFASLFTQASERPWRSIYRRRLKRWRRNLNPTRFGIQKSGAKPWELLLSGPGRGRQLFKSSLLRDMAKAKHVRIITAYFIPTWRLRRALARVVRNGGRVELILAGRSDVMIVRLASRSLYTRLMNAGVEIYEYQPQVLHAKLILVDDAVYVGSANLDTRSLNINHELMVRLDDSAVADEAGQIFDDVLRHCRAVDPKIWKQSRNFFFRLIEKIAYFLAARIDPHLTSLLWRRSAHDALKRKVKRAI